MIAPQCSRDREQLCGLLSGQLTETVAADMTQHLEHCEDCRRRLELLAAGADWWRDAEQYLSDDELDLHESAPDRPFGCDLRSRGVGRGSAGWLPGPLGRPTLLGRLDSYDILGVIGCGGMGIVLKGHDRELNRYVAIKVLAPHYATNGAARKRFARSAGGGSGRAPARVGHPQCERQRPPAVSGDATRCGPIAAATPRRTGTAGDQGRPADRAAGRSRPAGGRTRRVWCTAM